MAGIGGSLPTTSGAVLAPLRLRAPSFASGPALVVPGLSRPSRCCPGVISPSVAGLCITVCSAGLPLPDEPETGRSRCLQCRRDRRRRPRQCRGERWRCCGCTSCVSTVNSARRVERGAQSLPSGSDAVDLAVTRRLTRCWGCSAGGEDPRVQCRCGAPDFEVRGRSERRRSGGCDGAAWVASTVRARRR
jgi:hypothetical protein